MTDEKLKSKYESLKRRKNRIPFSFLLGNSKAKKFYSKSNNSKNNKKSNSSNNNNNSSKKCV
jgi:hypothetical protein